MEKINQELEVALELRQVAKDTRADVNDMISRVSIVEANLSELCDKVYIHIYVYIHIHIHMYICT